MEQQEKVLVVEEESISFIRRRGELTKLLKSVDKISIEAVRLLESTMNNPEVDLKTRISCAKEIISINVDVAKLVNQDNLQRMIAQIRLKPKGNTGNLVEDDSTPTLDFDTVQSV